jgi:hypothetical protein
MWKRAAKIGNDYSLILTKNIENLVFFGDFGQILPKKGQISSKIRGFFYEEKMLKMRESN